MKVKYASEIGDVFNPPIEKLERMKEESTSLLKNYS